MTAIWLNAMVNTATGTVYNVTTPDDHCYPNATCHHC